jgi:hypothetical protein
MNPNHRFTHFSSVNGQVMIIGQSTIWEGFQEEIDYFHYHADRIGEFLGCGTNEISAYHSEGSSYAYSKYSKSGRVNGIYSSELHPMSDLIHEII